MRTLLAIAAAALGWAQAPDASTNIEGLPPSSLQLARIRVHMEEILDHQPNYTCLETVDRSYRAASARQAQYDDTLRLEVALVDGKEMFAWPGSKKFEETDLRKLIPNGTFGNGNFALHARSVFLGRTATFQYRGAEIYVGAPGPLERYDFDVPRMVSGYTIRVWERSGVAGYRGSFWADKQTLDVRRLEVIAEDIPADLGVRSASDRMDYARLAIGNGEFLLPAESELRMTDMYGIESINHVRFTGCRQYTGESTLRFDDPDPGAAATAPAIPAETDLPAGLSMVLSLDETISVSSAAVGDPVHATLTNDLRRKGELIAPKGSATLGRVSRIERHSNYAVVGITLVSIETGTASFRVNARLDGVAGIQFLNAPRNIASQVSGAAPGEGLIVLNSARALLNHGILFYWRT